MTMVGSWALGGSIRSYSRRALPAVRKDTSCSAAGELNCARRKQVQHERTTPSHSGMVGTVRAVDEPAAAAAIKQCLGVHRHDQVNLTARVSMVRSRDRRHFDNIDAESVRLRSRLDEAPKSNPIGLAVAHPSRGNRTLTQAKNGLAFTPVGGKPMIEIVLEVLVQRTILNSPCHLRDQSREDLGATRCAGRCHAVFLIILPDRARNLVQHVCYCDYRCELGPRMVPYPVEYIYYNPLI